jgi:hypothetical protein
MNRVKARELVQGLIDQCNRVDNSDRRAVDSLREKSAAAAKQIFGDSTVYLKLMREVKYHPESVSSLSDPTTEANRARAQGVGKLAAILREMLMEVLTGR